MFLVLRGDSRRSESSGLEACSLLCVQSCMRARNLQPWAVGGRVHACTIILSRRITERDRPINARFGLRACTQVLCVERP
jgi:hypothetical protein